MTLFGCGGEAGSVGYRRRRRTGHNIRPQRDHQRRCRLGPINGGDVKVYAVKDGQVDTSAVLGTERRRTDGSYTITLFSVPHRPGGCRSDRRHLYR